MAKINFTIGEQTNELLNLIAEVEKAFGNYVGFIDNYWSEDSEDYHKACDAYGDIYNMMCEQLGHVISDSWNSRKGTI